MRKWVTDRLTYTDGTQMADLLNPEQTSTWLILALENALKAGFPLLITSVRTDHGPDSDLGPHGHSGGFAADLWPSDEGKLQKLVQHFCTGNKAVVKIGLGGAARSVSYDPGTTIVFEDNSTPHIHIEAYAQG